MVAYKIIVAGVVQGVGFRYYTKQEADRLGLQGTVMNLNNGNVKIHVQGVEEVVLRFLEWCHSGPATATVDKLEYEKVAMSDFDSFQILR